MASVTERYARWLDKSGKWVKAAIVDRGDGKLRIRHKARTWTAKFCDHSGIIREVPTGCTDKQAALSVLAELRKREERIMSGVLSPAESSAADNRHSATMDHLADYVTHLKAKGSCPIHVKDTERLARRLIVDCKFNRLRDINPEALERWLVGKSEANMAPRTRNSYLQALRGFANWLVICGRMTANPLIRVSKADERSDRRRTRRALDEEEMRKLLFAARWRPLAELGRLTIERPLEERRHKRDTWIRKDLAFSEIESAIDRARVRLRNNPEYVAELDRRGRERSLVYKTLLLTGLRRGELASITLGQCELEGSMPVIRLNAADEKNRKGTDIPLQRDLAAELGLWIAERRRSLRIDGGHTGEPLFSVPRFLIRSLDRDLKLAGIPKKDDRGRTVDVHAMRHSFGTMLSTSGVAPRTAQAAMRHSRIDLTMNVYTDPRLLDVAGAIASLPALSTTSGPPATKLATGTDGVGIGPSSVAPTVAPTSGHHGQSEAISVQTVATARVCLSHKKPPENVGFQGGLLGVADGARTRDFQIHNLAL